MWLCYCSCGNEKTIRGKSLKLGETISCGCYANESRANRQRTHGMSKSRAYFCYRNMINRCYWKKLKYFNDYGGRGITVCKRWMNFENFFKDMGDPPKGMTLDRINNNGPYSPKNCRWATMFDQARNKRNNVFYKIGPFKFIVSEWVRLLGYKHAVTAEKRLKEIGGIRTCGS